MIHKLFWLNLVKAGDGAPSAGKGQLGNFPFSYGSRPAQPNVPTRGVNPQFYRPAPKILNQRLAGNNPAGGGNGNNGNPEFDDNAQVPKKTKSQDSKDFLQDSPHKYEKKAEDQCKVDEKPKKIVSRIDEDDGLVRAAGCMLLVLVG